MVRMTLPTRDVPVFSRDHISHSSVTLYQGCPLRFYFRYVAGLPETTVGASLVLGAAVHSGLQFHFEQLLAGNSAPDLDTLLEVFWDSWHQHDHQQVLFGKGENLNTIGHLADRMFRAFQQSSLACPTGRIIAVEEELRGELIPGLPDLLARVDLIVETDDAVEVTDFKTARTAWSTDHVVESASQLLLYGELAKPLAEGKKIRLGFAVLTKTKVPDISVHSVPTNPQQVERTKRVVERVWRAIEEGHFYPAPSPLNCPSCPYREPCRTWRG
jgi:CRISPR/Cas system-associated exonuclease Cas4 (RecB family)